MKLNISTIKNLKPAGKAYKVADGGGLFLHVTTSGAKSWRYKFRYNGKEGLLTFGLYPDISLAEARELHRKAREQLARGENPSWSKQKSKIMGNNQLEITFEKIARKWHDSRKNALSPKYAELVMRNFETDVFPKIGNLPIDQIETPLILKTLKAIEQRGAIGSCRTGLIILISKPQWVLCKKLSMRQFQS